MQFPWRRFNLYNETVLDLSLSPSTAEISLKPGQTVTQAITITNGSDQDWQIVVDIRDFSPANERGGVQVLDTNSLTFVSLANSDYQLQKPFLLRSGSSAQLILNLEAPADIPNRDYPVVLLAQARQAVPEQFVAVGAEIAGEVASTLLVRVTDSYPASSQWQLELGKIPAWRDSLQRFVFQPVVRNDGASFAIPEGTILLLNAKNETIEQWDILPERVLAGTRRQLRAAVQDGSDPRSSAGEPFKSQHWALLGKHTLRATIRNDSDGPLVVEQSFWAFPWLVLGLGLVVLVAGITWWQRRQSME